MAGVPHHALDRYLAKLLQAGHRVAICEHLEDAAPAKGLIRRDVTPGTLTEDDLLDPRRANHLAALHAQGPTVGLACCRAWPVPHSGRRAVPVAPRGGAQPAADQAGQGLVDIDALAGQEQLQQLDPQRQQAHGQPRGQH